jgi:[ribosomal protein S5]-alanine N-acetyltransferase
MPTTLETARLVGRPPQPGDVPALLALYGSVEVAARMYPDGRPRTEAQLRSALAADLAHWEAHGFGRFMWHERDTGEVVVRCGPKLALRGGRPELDMHWTVRVDRHRRGLAAEAAEAVMRACFDGLGAESVTAVVRVDNAASQALARALGFAFERDVDEFGAPHRLYRRRAG